MVIKKNPAYIRFAKKLTILNKIYDNIPKIVYNIHDEMKVRNIEMEVRNIQLELKKILKEELKEI